MMFETSLPQQLWVEAFFTAAFLSNLLPTSVIDKMISSFKILHGKPLVYTTLRAFGCACYPYLRPYTENKFDPKSLSCVFVGYNERYKGYRCYHPPTGRVFISRHVLFDEESLPYKDKYRHLLPAATTYLNSSWRLQEPPVSSQDQCEAEKQQEEIGRTVPVRLPMGSLQPAPVPAQVAGNDQEQIASSSSSSESDSDNEAPPVAPLVPANSHKMTTRGKAGVMKPNPRYALMAIKGIPQVPRTLVEALNHPGWNGSMAEEKDMCDETHTWDLVPAPPDVKPIGCGWIHKVKLNADGTLLKLRSRLVARGNQQEEGVNFLETYSPVVRTATVRMVLHFAVIF